MYRKSRTEDMEGIYRLICGMEGKTLPLERFLSIYESQLADGHYLCLVYEQEGRVLGAINLRFEDQLHHAETIAEVLELVVDPACRGRQIGKELLERGCQAAREAGCTQIEVACNQLRTQAHRFYLREGLHNFHYRFSKSLLGEDGAENAIGR